MLDKRDKMPDQKNNLVLNKRQITNVIHKIQSIKQDAKLIL